MRVVLQGSLQFFSQRELLALLSSGHHTGTFDAEGPAGRLRLTVQDGLLSSAEAAGAADAVAVMGKLLEWKEGIFNFLDGVALPDGAAPLRLEIPAVIEEAEQRAADQQRILDLYPDDSIVFPVVNQPEGDISLKPIEFKILLHFAAGKTLAQLLSALKMPALELYPIVRELQKHGLLASGSFDPEATSITPVEVPFLKKDGDANATQPTAPQAKSPAPKPAPLKPLPDVEVRPRTVETPNPAEATIVQARAPESAKPSPSKKEDDPKAKSEPKPAAKAEAAKPEAAKPARAKEPEPARPPAAKTSENRAPLVAMLTSDDYGSFPVLEDNSSIGRADPSDIVLPDASISTKHARIVRGDDGFHIEDLGSRNGTFVNGEKVTDKRPLADGDIVRIGKVILTFNVAKEADVKDVTQPDIRK
jgi:hypothetical protein